jgi:hypothetical protein
MSHHVAKVSSEGEKCPILGMQYILLALVYFWENPFILSCAEGIIPIEERRLLSYL